MARHAGETKHAGDWHGAKLHGRRPTRPAPRGRSKSGRTPSILIVEDDRDIAESAREAIERFIPGSKVTVASSYATGMAAMERQHVDLALVDYKMPGKNGLDFVARAHDLEPGLPVVLMTGFGSVDVAARAINRHGIRGFLPKPFDAVVLAETVERVLAQSTGARG